MHGFKIEFSFKRIFVSKLKTTIAYSQANRSNSSCCIPLLALYI